MSLRGFKEPLLKSNEQILNLIIRKFKSYFPPGKRLGVDGNAKLLMENSSQPFRNVVKFFIAMVALHTALHTLCDHVFVYLYII